MEDLLQVGIISQTHGIRGEVKVFPTTDDAKRFKKLKEVPAKHVGACLINPNTQDMEARKKYLLKLKV